MGTATAAQAAEEVAFHSAAELREVLTRLLESVDSDERVGPLFRAARARTRFEFTDFPLAVNVASRGDESEQCLSWDFDREPPWAPKLTFAMSSAVTNSYLQGRESMPVLIARGWVRTKIDSRAALLFLPAARLLVEPYRNLVAAEYPHLLLDANKRVATKAIDLAPRSA